MLRVGSEYSARRESRLLGEPLGPALRAGRPPGDLRQLTSSQRPAIFPRCGRIPGAVSLYSAGLRSTETVMGSDLPMRRHNRGMTSCWPSQPTCHNHPLSTARFSSTRRIRKHRRKWLAHIEQLQRGRARTSRQSPSRKLQPHARGSCARRGQFGVRQGVRFG